MPTVGSREEQKEARKVRRKRERERKRKKESGLVSIRRELIRGRTLICRGLKVA